MRGHIVKNNMHLDPVRKTRCYLVQKGGELLGPMAGGGLTNDRAGCDIKSRQQTGGSVPLVIMRPRCRLAGFHRQWGLGASQGLDLGFLIHREDNGMIRWVHIKANNIGELVLKVRIARDLEGSHLMRRQLVFLENIEHG